MVTYTSDYIAFGNKRWSVCGKDVQYICCYFWLGSGQAMSNKQGYEEVAQCKRVVTVIDCPLIPARIRQI